jgi:prepilin-type N-terminal cleavage/methylation domain-containing protein
MKKGFTILEILIALTILVIIFALMTIFYVRGAKTRNIITAYNEVGEILSQSVDVISNGRKSFMGKKIPSLKDATTITTAKSYQLTYGDGTNNISVEIKKDTDTETSIYIDSKSLDPNKKVVLLSGSKFEYFYPDGTLKLDENIAPETIVLVKIILVGKSTNPAMKNMIPMRIETLLRLKNKTSF